VTVFHVNLFLIVYFYSLGNQTDRSGISNLHKHGSYVEKGRKAVLHTGMHSFQECCWENNKVLFCPRKSDYIVLILILIVATYHFS
jgi:hypothetical protein